jgi:CHASE2 domain-containing sensor protein
MQRENDANASELIARLEQAHELLGEALSLLKRKKGKAPVKSPSTTKEKPTNGALDFATPIRAFVKRHGNGMSGPKKFTLLVAYLTKGETTKNVSLSEIEKQWNKMKAKSLLGMKFNRFYSSQAKDNDWVNAGKTGSYNLRPSWKEIFNE